MTSEVGIVKTVVALLFALIGGAISAFLPKLKEEDRTLAGRTLASLSPCVEKFGAAQKSSPMCCDRGPRYT